jgi:hypothetical protein
LKCEARKKTIIPGINLYNWFWKKYILEAPSVISRDLIQLALNKIDKPKITNNTTVHNNHLS